MPAFDWPDKEDDSSSKHKVLEELLAQLAPPRGVIILPVERKILVALCTERQNKRTHLTAKTDYVAVLEQAAQQAKLDPGSIIHHVAMLLETKTTAALERSSSLYRGGAALECLAVQLKLLDMGMLVEEDAGVPVVLTDLNR